MEDGFRPPAKEKNITHIFSFLLSLFQKIAIERQARPLRRWLEKNVITALSKKLISGEVEEGDLVEVGVSPDAAAKAAERRQRSKAAAAGTSDDEEGWVSVEEDGDSGLIYDVKKGKGPPSPAPTLLSTLLLPRRQRARSDRRWRRRHRRR